MNPTDNNIIVEIEMEGELKEIGDGTQREGLDNVKLEEGALRRHRFMSIERLNVFSDAVFATITTFMVRSLYKTMSVISHFLNLGKLIFRSRQSIMIGIAIIIIKYIFKKQ